MKINIALNTKSIAEAKKKLLELKKKLQKGEMIKDLLNECVIFITKQTEFYLDNSGLGSNVIADIKSSWKVEQTENKVVMTNTSEKAVYVEFGVGIVGQGDPHPNANEANYEYNMPSNAKDSDGSWHFFSNEADLDIPKDAIEYGDYGNGKNNRMSIYTSGTKGVWYAYNAIVDLKAELPNIWKKIKERHIG